MAAPAPALILYQSRVPRYAAPHDLKVGCRALQGQTVGIYY